MSKRKLIVLTGPTAVGKSDLSVKLAKKINAEIISADSMQIYKYMDIGSAKITEEEMQGVKHHLLSVLDPKEECNAFRYVTLAKAAMEEIFAKGKIPLLVGGTMFYIHALLYDVDFSESNGISPYREELERLAETEGNHQFHERLKEIDPVSYEKIHENNVKRVIRALEYYHDTNSPISSHNEREKQKGSPYDFRYFVLTDDRERIYEKIDARVDLMMEKGLLDEVRALKERGYTRDMVSMQGIGYKELLDHLDNLYSLEEAVRIIKRDSRHYAKRQMTWFRSEKDAIFIDKRDYGSDEDQILEKLLEYIADIKTE